MTNHLATQQSAYLLQHADQPVDGYPWGTEALARQDQALRLALATSQPQVDFTHHEALALIHRLKTTVDAATASGNGVAARVLLALSGKVAGPNAAKYHTAAQRCVRAFAATVRADPASCTSMLVPQCY